MDHIGSRGVKLLVKECLPALEELDARKENEMVGKC